MSLSVQQRMGGGKDKCPNDDDSIARKYHSMMIEGKLRQTVRWVTNRDGGGVLRVLAARLELLARDGEEAQLVALRAHHQRAAVRAQRPARRVVELGRAHHGAILPSAQWLCACTSQGEAQGTALQGT